MAFNPDDYLSRKAAVSSGFDPDSYLKNKNIKIGPDVSQVESGVRGLSQGISMGFSDEITGALESLLSDKSYEQARDESRKAYDDAQAANPMTYGAGQIGGAVATAFVPGLGEVNLAKAAALGGVQALGDSKANNAADLTKDTALGVGIGGATYGVMDKVVGPGLKYLKNKAGEYVPEAIDQVTKKVGKGFFGVDEKATENYLKHSADVNKAYSMGELADAVLDKADDSSVLNELRAKTSQLSTDAWGTLNNKAGIAKDDILSAITSYIDNPKAGLTIDGITIGNAQEQAIKRLQGLQKQIASLPGDQINESNLKHIIQNLDDNINWGNPEMGPTNDAIKSVRGFIDQSLKGQNPAYENAMQKVEGITKAQQEIKSVFQNRLNPENYDKFTKQVKNLVNKDDMSAANQAVGKIKEHTGYDLKKDIVDSWTKSQFEKGDINGARNTLFGTVVGSAAGSLAGPVGGFVGGAIGATAGKQVDKYAGPIFKKFLDGQIASGDFVRAYGPRLGKYAPVLEQAANRGSQSLIATHFLLSQRDPNYRQTVKSLEDKE